MLKMGVSVATSLLFLASGALAEKRGNCDESFDVPFRAGSELHLDLRAGDINILGTDEPIVRVRCYVKESGRAKDVSVIFDEGKQFGRLSIKGGPNNEVRMDIQVPRRSHLIVRSTAGNLELTGVDGHKDVSMRAGDLTIDVGDAGDYSLAEASVTAGDLKASAFGVHKGGLFRSFRRENSTGKYHLRASLWAGDLKLK